MYQKFLVLCSYPTNVLSPPPLPSSLLDLILDRVLLVSVLYSITFSCVRNEYMSFLVSICEHRVIIFAALCGGSMGSVYFLTAVHMAEW